MRRILLTLVTVGIAGCPAGGPEDVLTHSLYTESLGDAGLSGTRLSESWLRAAVDALDDPMPVDLPHHETGALLPHEPRALGLEFDAVEGQRLRLTFDTEPGSTGRVFLQLFYLPGADREPTEVAAIGTGPNLPITLRESGRHVVRIQPELLATVIYELRIELEAALPFPVSGLEPAAVGSFFGDPRDAGRRRHEGVDIFAPRMTPLVAVADGVATTRTNRLGGNTVWLRADDRRYYYAHLERAAFEGRRRVAAGEVIGYVGNSGNAKTTPTHLHFGIYQGRRGSIDPLPYLRSRTLAAAPRVPGFTARYVRTTASSLNFRASPAITNGNVLGSLPEGTVGRALARSGQWLRLRTIDGREGWIHDRFQHTLSPYERQLVPEETRLVYSEPLVADQAVGTVEAALPLQIFAEHAGALLVGFEPDKPLGWLPAPALPRPM